MCVCFELIQECFDWVLFKNVCDRSSFCVLSEFNTVLIGYCSEMVREQWQIKFLCLSEFKTVLIGYCPKMVCDRSSFCVLSWIQEYFDWVLLKNVCDRSSFRHESAVVYMHSELNRHRSLPPPCSSSARRSISDKDVVSQSVIHRRLFVQTTLFTLIGPKTLTHDDIAHGDEETTSVPKCKIGRAHVWTPVTN